MVLKFWWMIFVWILIGVLVFVVYYFFIKRRSVRQATRKKQIFVAHTERLAELPSFAKVMRQYKTLVLIAIICLFLSLLAGIILSLRPSSHVVEHPDLHNRDIVLCLDISGSMLALDREITNTFSKMAKEFDGERIGLVVFDSSSSSIFPLTDDYGFVSEQLKNVANQLGGNQVNYSSADSIFNGVYEGEGSSLIGDGLASCVMRFDALDAKRSRSIILATDNYANGAQIVDLSQASAFAKDKGVRVYGINPSDLSSNHYNDAVAAAFKKAVMSTDGGYYKLDYSDRGDASIVRDIVQKISAQEATRYKGSPRIVQSDTPQWFLAVAALSTAGILFVAWRLKR